ncbi:MAG: DUF308 domain-containing protein, partial [Pseudomonadota bacterium]
MSEQEGQPLSAAEAAAGAALIDALKRNAGLTIGIGIIMVLAGLGAVIAPAVAGLSLTIMVGFTLAIAGISQCVLAFKAGAFGRGLAMFLVGAIMAFAGFYMVSQPVSGLASLTI